MRKNILLAFALLSAAPALAQAEYRWEQSDTVKVRFKVHQKLHPIPVRLGTGHTELKMQFEPKDDGDKIWGRYGAFNWPLLLLDFKAEAKAPATGPSPGGKEAETPEAVKAATSFSQWVTERDPAKFERKFVVKGKDERGRGKSPDRQWWEFTDVVKMTNGRDHFDQLWYSCGAVYKLEGREVALVCRVPIKRGTRPDPNHTRWIETMLRSLEPIEVEGESDEVDQNRDAHANTPERLAELEKAKANIANLKGWDYFTAPNYIVLYAWDPEKQTKRRDGLKFSKSLVAQLELMRELYMKLYPPHDKILNVYSVLRICDNPEEFQKYGDSPPNVVGWFNPLSRELVVFDDKQHVYGGDKDVVATTMHEGWHQYAHTYFGGPPVELHRWFDEGHGDYFGAFVRKGNDWEYVTDRGRYQAVRRQVAMNTFVPVREIVSWNKDKFYGPKGGEYYAQGYSLVDFLRRGESKLGRRFDPLWGTIIDKYRTTILETKDQKKALEKAFEGVDWEALETAWVEWVKNHMK